MCVMNKDSSTPLYQQIVDDIKQQITDGTLKEGDKLMTEQNLGEVYQVSRITVRKAIEYLVDEGYVMKRQGIGTFVAKKKLNRKFSNKIMSFTETCQAEGKIPTSELISLEWTQANPKVAMYLQIEEGARVLKIVRVRKSDGDPVMLEETYFPSKYSYLSGENLTGSIYEALRKHGTVMAHAVKTIGICYATNAEAEYLHVSSGQALLFHKEQVFDPEGEPIHYSQIIVDPERYKLTLFV